MDGGDKICGYDKDLIEFLIGDLVEMQLTNMGCLDVKAVNTDCGEMTVTIFYEDRRK